MIDWAVVGITAAGLIIVIFGIYYITVLIDKIIDLYIYMKKEINKYF